MALKSDKTVAAEKKNLAEPKPMFAFGKENYRLLLIGLAVIVLGFILMVGGGSDDPNKFNFALFNFQRLTLAPVLILAGFVIEIFAIMKKPKQD